MADTSSKEIGELSQSIQRHNAALEELKDVPNILKKLVDKIGIEPDRTEPGNRPDWSLGLSDDEDNTDDDANRIINQGNDFIKYDYN